MRHLPHAALFALPFSLVACGGATLASFPSDDAGPEPTSDAGADAASIPDSGRGRSCTMDSDCAPIEQCGFYGIEECSTTGTCFPASEHACGAYSPGCACDGTDINVACTGLPSGYYPKPLLSLGSCECTSNADCGPKEQCGFPGDDCGTTGSCFALPEVACQSYSPGCACDGTEINIACTGLPTGYYSKPLAYDGTCNQGVSPPAGCGGGPACAVGQICAYAVNAACGAPGTCVAEVDNGVVCNAISPGCSCSGDYVSLACNGLPAGYASQPVAYMGLCADAGAK